MAALLSITPLAWGLGASLVCLSVAAQAPPSAALEQAASPLTIRSLIASAAASHPSLLGARLEAQAGLQDVTAAERQRWPSVSAVLESSTGSSTSTSTRLLRVQQTLWDGGRNTSRIAEAQSQAELGDLRVVLQQQQLALQIASAWQSMLAASERVKVAQQTIERLEVYRSQMQRRVEAQASSRIDLELANSRRLQTQVELTTAQSSLKVALIKLEQLSGQMDLNRRLPSLAPLPPLTAAEPFRKSLARADWSDIAAQSPSVAKARLDVELVRHRLQTKNAEKWPQLYLRVDQTLAQSQGDSNPGTLAYAGLSYTPGAGFSNLVEAQALATRMAGAEQTIETAMREMREVLQADGEEFFNAASHIAALEKSVYGADLVLESYQRQFEAGRKTWQDLLNAVRELAQNQYALADANARLMGARHRLEIRMGQSPYSP